MKTNLVVFVFGNVNNVPATFLRKTLVAIEKKHCVQAVDLEFGIDIGEQGIRAVFPSPYFTIARRRRLCSGVPIREFCLFCWYVFMVVIHGLARARLRVATAVVVVLWFDL
jgi:hypothetical protein